MAQAICFMETNGLIGPYHFQVAFRIAGNFETAHEFAPEILDLEIRKTFVPVIEFPQTEDAVTGAEKHGVVFPRK
jgi:hypothetical protein